MLTYYAINLNVELTLINSNALNQKLTFLSNFIKKKRENFKVIASFILKTDESFLSKKKL